MNQLFDTAFDRLNDAQRAAVTQIDGPVLVIAGPGTGKTQLLSLRVVQILRQTDTDASNILCLTFTNAAATNMRERLATLVGHEAQRVMVRTFHSFASEIMNLYPEYFWNGARLTIAPDALQLEIIQNMLSELPFDNPLAMKFAGSYTSVKDVRDALKLTREAGLTADKLAAMLQVNEAYIDLIEPDLVALLSAPLSFKKLPQLAASVAALPDQLINESVVPLVSLSSVIKDSLIVAIEADAELGKTTNTGKWKNRWVQSVGGEKKMQSERDRLKWWQSLVDAYEIYRRKLHARGYYDYSDMLIEVITQLEAHPELLSQVQERFLYVLIDEFQDTNKAQLRLANLVAAHPSNEANPNIMAVGDDDQSIFAFNGAELSNMLSFERSYPDTKVIVLEENYRSSQLILDSAAAVIHLAEDRLVKRRPGLSKNLIARNQPANTSIRHISYPTRDHELSAVARSLGQQWQSQPEQTIAVLARSHDSLERIASLLSALQVPIRYERQQDVLQSEIVQLVLLLAKTVLAVGEGDQKLANHYLARLLRHPVWAVEPSTLWKLAVRQRSQADWLEALLDHSDAKLVALANWLLWLAGEASYQPLPIMLEYLLGLRAGTHLTSPLREYYLATRHIDNHYLQVLSASQLLLQLADEFSDQPVASLEDLVRFCQLNTFLSQTINDSSWFVSGDRAVELLSVHKAKGQEFDHVYIISAVEDNWKPRRSGRKPPANLPLQPIGEIDDDYARLMYVAMTRAKQSIHISSFGASEQGKQIIATPLLEALPAAVLDDAEAEDPIIVLEQALSWPSLDGALELQLLKPVLENYSLSVTALLRFLDITGGGPQAFLERDLLRIPEVSNASMGYGNAIHRALQYAQMTQPAPPLQAIIDAYETSLREQRLTDNDIARYLPHGEQVLNALFIDKGFSLPPNGQAEMSLSTNLEDVRLGGKIDHVIFHNGQLLITDYKTGKPLSSFSTRDKTKEIKAWKHRTQLTFYALLSQLSGRFAGLQDMQTRMLYVEADTAREMSLNFTPSAEDLQRLSALITAVWPKIISLNLPDVTNYSSDMSGITAFEDDLISGLI
jgi:DNA helicase-2/ATP-dependent DNA helicase PcrA